MAWLKFKWHIYSFAYSSELSMAIYVTFSLCFWLLSNRDYLYNVYCCPWWIFYLPKALSLSLITSGRKREARLLWIKDQWRGVLQVHTFHIVHYAMFCICFYEGADKEGGYLNHIRWLILVSWFSRLYSILIINDKHTVDFILHSACERDGFLLNSLSISCGWPTGLIGSCLF